jgi:hypothetical protein
MGFPSYSTELPPICPDPGWHQQFWWGILRGVTTLKTWGLGVRVGTRAVRTTDCTCPGESWFSLCKQNMKGPGALLPPSDLLKGGLSLDEENREGSQGESRISEVTGGSYGKGWWTGRCDPAFQKGEQSFVPGPQAAQCSVLVEAAGHLDELQCHQWGRELMVML